MTKKSIWTALSVFTISTLGLGLATPKAYAGTIQLSDGPRVSAVPISAERLKLCITRSDGSCTWVGPTEGFEKSKLQDEVNKLKTSAVIAGVAGAAAFATGSALAVCTLGECVAAASIPAAVGQLAKEGALISLLSFAEGSAIVAVDRFSPFSKWRRAGQIENLAASPDHFVFSSRTEKQFIADMKSVFGKNLELKEHDSVSAR